jgi:hypothetical protein
MCVCVCVCCVCVCAVCVRAVCSTMSIMLVVVFLGVCGMFVLCVRARAFIYARTSVCVRACVCVHIPVLQDLFIFCCACNSSLIA